MTSEPRLGLLMAISPGEAELAADSLRRALAQAPEPLQVFLVNNGGFDAPDRWLVAEQFDVTRVRILTARRPPRPYFEIGRTIFDALAQIAVQPPSLLFKIDPDTLVRDRGFFTDILTLQADTHADFLACHVRSQPADHLKRTLRLISDFAPLGVSRVAGRDRYGSALRPRVGRAWYAGLRLGAVQRAQPSGGFYAVRGAFLATLAQRGLLATEGANGLEWNDDTLLPMAVRTAGGVMCDVRATPFADGWRWLHGSRYFNNEEARAPGLRALHPVKFDEAGRALRAALDASPPRSP